MRQNILLYQVMGELISGVHRNLSRGLSIFSQGRPEPLETKAFTDPGGRGYIKIGQFFIQKRVVANGKDLFHQAFLIFFFICNLHDVLYTNI